MSGNMDSTERDFFAQSLQRIEKHQEKTCDELKELKDDVHKIDISVACLDQRVSDQMDQSDKKVNAKWMKIGLVITSVAAIGAVGTVFVVL